MKKVIVLFTALCFILPAFAVIPARKLANPPQGTFKKKKDGTIIQYNDKGKKIGTYKLDNGSYKKKK